MIARAFTQSARAPANYSANFLPVNVPFSMPKNVIVMRSAERIREAAVVLLRVGRLTGIEDGV